MPLSLVLGVNGQDGSYMAEYLVSEGYNVIGVDLHEEAGPYAPKERYEYRQLDLRKAGMLQALLKEVIPEKVFHLSAVHGPAGFAYEPVWREAVEVNTISVHEILEYARTCTIKPALAYASSSKVFGDSPHGLITESSPRRMDGLYAVTKIAAEGVIDYYRKKYGIKASIFYYFNHESPRRGTGFFPQLLARELNNCIHDAMHRFEVNTLSFFCDWGSAKEYMEITNKLIDASVGEDFIVATGQTWLGRDLIEDLWRRFGLDSANHVIERSLAASASKKFEASVQKMKKTIHQKPIISAPEICEIMVNALQD